ncbi:Thioesterase/thiol ester dehydrase-isomerase [Nemania sp. FL0916]|nr:Thioesterase/thiol ester dehydrase-isomerase [Nemania sp. FL0916]
MTLPSAEEIRKGHGRLTYQEAMSLMPLSDKTADDGSVVRRYMSKRRAYPLGTQLVPLAREMGIENWDMGPGAYGGHVYSQASVAAFLTFRAARKVAGNGGKDKKFAIHTIHGFFPEAGQTDRPFIYEVKPLGSNALFPNFLVTARQPTSPSTNPEGDHYPEADASLPLGLVCFTAMVSFRPHSFSQFIAQESSPQARFAEILNSRRPRDWDPAPITDIEGVMAAIPSARRAIGTFPGLDMRKVDMREYNAGRPIHERRELILYRLLAPLSGTTTTTAGEELEGEGRCAIAISGPDAHISAHAFAADRNGLLMIGHHAGFGREFARAATLSYSFVVHVNAEDAVMTYAEDGESEWWVQEACFPRIEAGRGIIHTKIWSPRGVHVATEYQDGIVRRTPRPEDAEKEVKGKL